MANNLLNMEMKEKCHILIVLLITSLKKLL